MSKLHPFLWFDTQAEEAMNFYVAIFPNSKVLGCSRYGDAGPGPAGSVMTADFELDGFRITALNGGPHFQFSEAVSLMIDCADQAEVDYFWEKLLADGGEPSQCGWLKDRFGFSWQVVPKAMFEIFQRPDKAGAQRAMQAMLKMIKLDVAALEAAYAG